jgi:hypothetical protein
MTINVIDDLNRSAKLFIDRASVASVDEALERLEGFRMHLHVDGSAASGPGHQAALLTALNCGRRTFLGGVTVSGSLDAPLKLPVAPGAMLKEAIAHLGGAVVAEIPAEVPLVCFGEPPASLAPRAFAMRTTFDGWRGGVVPLGSPCLTEVGDFTPAGVLAGALAVSELFAHFDDDALAGWRAVGMSLWDQRADADWTSPSADGPSPAMLPADFWLIGLGHLGQAFLWTIGLLPFGDPGAVRLFLQDVDEAGGSTESTSILTGAGDRRRKTRICAEWAERRGFRTQLIERRFGPDLRVADDEPLLALCGVDNPQARAMLEGAGFHTVFEAGLGAGVEDFRLIRTHSFPAPMSASRIWSENQVPDATEAADAATKKTVLAAYDQLRSSGVVDECGLTQLAEVAVGAPFVGAAAAAVLLAQAIRLVVDGRRSTVFNLDLRAMQHRSLVERNETDLVIFGTTASA